MRFRVSDLLFVTAWVAFSCGWWNYVEWFFPGIPLVPFLIIWASGSSALPIGALVAVVGIYEWWNYKPPFPFTPEQVS
jgi:hypothetical protein